MRRRLDGFVQRARLEPQLHPRLFGCPLLAAFGWLSRGAITPSIATHNAADAVGIALTPQAPGLGGIPHLNRFGLQLALALKLPYSATHQ